MPSAPVISVDEATLTRVSFLVRGEIGGSTADVTEYGIELSETLFDSGGPVKTFVPEEITPAGFNHSVTGLKHNCTYYLRAYVANGHSKLYSVPISCRTPETSVASISNVFTDGINLYAIIEDNGGRVLEDYGFVWGPADDARALRRSQRHPGTLYPDGKTFSLPLQELGYEDPCFILAYAEDTESATGYSRISLKYPEDPYEPDHPHHDNPDGTEP